ncbi:hypothetical protein AB1Y20_001309 [Prymnesium parvum]|uniref:Ubiquitinyl hydrolase 1 n=1 Tax=Prymnesium parvum TaxID=97485 RepID=A0AB34K987_PRYPA
MAAATPITHQAGTSRTYIPSPCYSSSDTAEIQQVVSDGEYLHLYYSAVKREDKLPLDEGMLIAAGLDLDDGAVKSAAKRASTRTAMTTSGLTRGRRTTHLDRRRRQRLRVRRACCCCTRTALDLARPLPFSHRLLTFTDRVQVLSFDSPATIT